MKSAEKGENLGEKLKKGILLVESNKRGGQRTPVIKPSWKLIGASAHAEGVHDKGPSPVLISARKLAAALWELRYYRRLSSGKMHRGDLRHIRHVAAPDPSTSSPDLPGSASGLRRQVMASLMQQHRSGERNNHTLQPVSPQSYGSSSMEVGHYNAAVTPSSSVDFRGTNYGLKTSTELIKVLNRIWALEEQHSSNMSLVKALKKELNHAHARIKELVRDRQNDKHEIEALKNQLIENQKNKNHEKIGSTIQSLRDELDDERKLRKRSETLHRKLARELYEVKSSFSNAVKEIEKGRDMRKLLEDLCDEFAWGIKNYEQEIHKLQQKYEKDWVEKSIRDITILHISESWLDERMQMKQEGGETTKLPSVVVKMSSEIESFLRAKRGSDFTSKGNMVHKSPNFRRSSLESIPLNMATSAPQHGGNDEDSDGSGSYCFELNKPSTSGVKQHKGNQIFDKLNYENFKESLPMRAIEEKNPSDYEKGKSEIGEVIEEGNENGENGKIDRKNLSKMNYVMDELIRSQYHHDISSPSTSQWRRNASPIRQWTPKLPSQEEKEISEPSNSKLPVKLKENTLKAKLIEARTRGQRSRSRLKNSKISF